MEDRYDLCRSLVAATHLPMSVTSVHTSDYLLRQRDIHLGPLRVWEMEFGSTDLERTARLVDQADPESYNLCWLRSGEMRTLQGAREASHGPGDVYPIDSSRPFELRTRNTEGNVVCFGVEVPKRLLFLPRARTDALSGRNLSAGEGMGALLGRLLADLVGAPEGYRPSDGQRLSPVVADLVTALFAQALESEDVSRVEPESRRRILVLRVRAFIQENLSDPRLTPEMISSAHHISTSYLHRIFQEEGRTVATLVRERRLERARAQLGDPALRSVPVHQIARNCGFTAPEVFSRVFSKAFGICPRDYRSQALRPGE